MGFVDLRDGDIDLEALVDLIFAILGGEDDAHSEDVVDFFKRHVLVLHLVPDGVGALHAFLNLIGDAHLLQGILDGTRKLIEELIA